MGFPFELFEQEFWKLFLHVHAYIHVGPLENKVIFWHPTHW